MQQVFLREWRRYRALSQADLAQSAGVTEATISRLEQPESSPAAPQHHPQAGRGPGDCPPRAVRAAVDSPARGATMTTSQWKPGHVTTALIYTRVYSRRAGPRGGESRCPTDGVPSLRGAARLDARSGVSGCPLRQAG